MKKRFEYKIYKIPHKKWGMSLDNEAMIKQLNKEGVDGWEIAESIIFHGGYTSTFVLKREI